jgi:hypothetical protein
MVIAVIEICESSVSSQTLPELIQAEGDTLLSAVHKLINSDHYKDCITVSMYKEGDKTCTRNYCGISLL